MVAYWVWNPSREAFVIPYTDFPIYWYSLCFVLGLYGAIVIARALIRSGASALVGTSAVDPVSINRYIERLAVYCCFGVILGARFGHIVFYEPLYYFSYPWEILNLRQGGLSSHGAMIGLFLAVWRFQKKPFGLPYLPHGADLLDLLAISSAWTAGCIRIGNFFNQEIVGTVTDMPWAVVFVSPLDVEGTHPLPRHPAQLYEALVAFVLLIPLLILGRKGKFATDGRIAGWYLIVTFTMRMFIETLKASQCEFDTGFFHMGQLLSVPAIILGIGLLVRARLRRSHSAS